MNQTQKIQEFDSNPVFLESGLESLLKMTNEFMSKVKTQTMENAL